MKFRWRNWWRAGGFLSTKEIKAMAVDRRFFRIAKHPRNCGYIVNFTSYIEVKKEE